MPTETSSLDGSDPEDVQTEEWLSTRAASKLTGVHAETIRRWIRSGAVEARRTGGPGRQQEVRRSDLIARTSPQPPDRPRAERSQILLPGERTVIADR